MEHKIVTQLLLEFRYTLSDRITQQSNNKEIRETNNPFSPLESQLTVTNLTTSSSRTELDCPDNRPAKWWTRRSVAASDGRFDT